MRLMVGIELGQAQSAYMNEIHLATDITFGTYDIKIDDGDYTLSLASALVLLEKSNANIVTGSKYSHIITEGEIVTNAVEMQKSANGGGIDASAGVDANGFSGKLKAALNLGSSKAKEASTSVKHQINFVTPEGQDGWRIGGVNGNPKLATKDLRGDAINSRKGDQSKPLCTLEAVDPDSPVSGRIRVQASLDDFRLHSKTSGNASLDSIKDGLEKDQPKLAKREHRAEQELRERVAAVALLLPKRRQADEYLFDIASRGFTFWPDIKMDKPL
jgi:hypothetical protein